MSRHIIVRAFEVTPTAEELAGCFADLGSDGQAQFFNALAETVKAWDTNGVFQWAWVFSPGQGLTREALDLVRDMGEHALAADRKEFAP